MEADLRSNISQNINTSVGTLGKAELTVLYHIAVKFGVLLLLSCIWLAGTGWMLKIEGMNMKDIKINERGVNDKRCKNKS